MSSRLETTPWFTKDFAAGGIEHDDLLGAPGPSRWRQ